MAFTDSFTRADESLEADAGWTLVSGDSAAAAIVSNAVSVTTGQNAGAIVCTDQSALAHYTQADIGATAYSLIAVRVTDGLNFIGLRYTDGDWQCYKRASGTWTLLGSYTVGLAAGDTAYIEVDDNDYVRCRVNGSLIIGPILDTFNNTVTRQGVIPRTANVTGWLDNFEAGSLVATSSIDTVSSQLLDGSTSNTLTVSTFAGNLTTLVLSDGTYSVDLFSTVSGSDPNYTFDVKDVAAIAVDTLGMPFSTPARTMTLTAGDGTTTAVATVEILPKTGWNVIDVTTMSTTEGSLAYNMTGTPADVLQFYWPTANGTDIAATGRLKTDLETGQETYRYYDSSDTKWKIGTISSTLATPTGTITASVDESDIVTGGKTIVLTLTDETFIAAGTGPIGSTANTQALIDGIDGDVVGGTGWDAVVKAGLVPADDVVRTSATVCTITLPAFASYSISATETISVVIPAAVLTGGSEIIASPMFTIADTGTTTVTAVAGLITSSSTELDIRDGGKTIVITLTDDTWVISGTPFNAIRQAIINGMTSAQTETLGWNNVVRDALNVRTVVRTSNDTVTIMLPTLSTYDITAQETITVTVPASALVTSADAIVADNMFTIATYSTVTAVRDTLGTTRTTATTRTGATRTTANSRDTIR